MKPKDLPFSLSLSSINWQRRKEAIDWGKGKLRVETANFLQVPLFLPVRFPKEKGEIT